MWAHVLSDARLVKQAGRFVWLTVDAEKERNAGFAERFAISGYPTFLVVDPATEKPVLRWPGSASVKQFERLLDDARVARRAAGGAGPEAALARADRANAEDRVDEAVAGYREALAQGGAAWSRRPRAVESLVLALQGAGRDEECAAVAGTDGAALPRGSSFANAVATGLGCALGADAGAPWRPAALERLEPLVRQASGLPDLLADDRAALLQTLADARQEAGDARASRAALTRLWRFLEAEARRTPSAELRASLDSWRVSAAIGLGRPALAVPALRASERALPDDYNPPARLALLYREAKRYPEAVAEADRALARAYGPRKLRVYDLKASSQERAGDRAGQERTLAEAVAFAATLPETQAKGGIGRLVARMQAQLDGLRGRGG